MLSLHGLEHPNPTVQQRATARFGPISCNTQRTNRGTLGNSNANGADAHLDQRISADLASSAKRHPIGLPKLRTWVRFPSPALAHHPSPEAIFADFPSCRKPPSLSFVPQRMGAFASQHCCELESKTHRRHFRFRLRRRPLGAVRTIRSVQTSQLDVSKPPSIQLPAEPNN